MCCGSVFFKWSGCLLLCYSVHSECIYISQISVQNLGKTWFVLNNCGFCVYTSSVFTYFAILIKSRFNYYIYSIVFVLVLLVILILNSASANQKELCSNCRSLFKLSFLFQERRKITKQGVGQSHKGAANKGKMTCEFLKIFVMY